MWRIEIFIAITITRDLVSIKGYNLNLRTN